jgi:RimJ/RimL family protein N-acetyltransferase
MLVEPITLEGKFVRLEPLKLDHLECLAAVGLEEPIWRWVPTQPRTIDDLRLYVETALDEQRRGVSLPFVTISKADSNIVGSTRFGNMDMPNRKVEIGWTWINPKWQRTAINTEAKLLMLTHAFETWGCIRVELKTDALNEKSRNAILRIGAQQEGILRRHMITDTGRYRDTVYFSILDDEWPEVKKNLLAKSASEK